jgi:hypothetical protein
MDTESDTSRKTYELGFYFVGKSRAMTALNDERAQSGGQRQRLGAKVGEGLRDENAFAAEVMCLVFFVLRISVRMHRAKLTVLDLTTPNQETTLTDEAYRNSHLIQVP